MSSDKTMSEARFIERLEKRIQLLTDLEWRRKYPRLRAYADELHHLPIVVPA